MKKKNVIFEHIKMLSLIERMDNKVKLIINNNMPKLDEVYECTNNNNPLVSLNETNAKRLVDRHSQNGYAIISACRGFNDFNLDQSNPQHKVELNRINNNRTNFYSCVIYL